MKTMKSKEGVSLPLIPFLANKQEPEPEHKPILKPNQIKLRECLLFMTDSYKSLEDLAKHKKTGKQAAREVVRAIEKLGLVTHVVGLRNTKQYKLTPKGRAEKNLIMESQNETIPE